MSAEVLFRPTKQFMEMALMYARHSTGVPKTGCVIVRDDEIVGFGFRQRVRISRECRRFGHKCLDQYILYHAEQMALQMAGELAYGAALYTTLEPCTYRVHHPPQPAMPPCADLISNAGIRYVVIGHLETNPRIQNKGFNHLHISGMHVLVQDFGLEDELRKLVVDYKASGNGGNGYGCIKIFKKRFEYPDEKPLKPMRGYKRPSPGFMLKSRESEALDISFIK